MKTPASQQADEFHIIAEAVPGVVLVAQDPDCRVVVGNAAACELFRVPPGTNLSRSPPSPAGGFRLCQQGLVLTSEQTPLRRACRGETLSDYEVEVHFDDGAVRYLQGNAMPLTDAYGRSRGAVAAYADLTAHRRAEQALRKSEERLRFTLEAARVGTWRWDIASGTVDWSGNLEGIHEMQPGSFTATFDAFLERVHADDRDRVLATIHQALHEGGEYRVEYREAITGGWIEGRGQVELDATGAPAGITGIAMDVTDRKRAEEALRENEERLRYTLEAARVGTWSWEIPTGAVGWSENLEGIYGVDPGSFDGNVESFLKGVHPDDRDDVQRAIEDALNGEREYLIEHRVLGEGGIGWLECRGRVERDHAGQAVRMVGICMDVTERKRAENLLRALANAGTTLATALDYETALDQVAQTVVPGWGDWCVVDVLHDDGTLETVTVAHSDPAKVEHARALRREYPSRLDAPTGVGYVVRTGEPLCRTIDKHELQRVAEDQRHLELFLELGLRSAVVVPLMARGRTLGALTLVTAESARDYDADELPHVQELARRCAFAVDNARLYREAQHELVQREQTELQLKRLNETLEQRVSERTALAERRAEQLRGLASELATAEQRERRRLAQTLHDDHQQLLVAAKLQVSMLRDTAARDADEGLSKLDGLLEEAVTSARTVSRELSPAVLYDAGLAAALRWLATIKREKYGLMVHVEADDEADPEAEDVSTFLYQAVRELLLNIVKHAETSEAWVWMSPASSEEVQIEVTDQGRGFDATKMDEQGANAGQFGLFGMRERLSLFGGRLRVGSQPGEGTRVTLLVSRRSEEPGGGGEEIGRFAPIQAPSGDTGGQRGAIRVLLADDHKMLRDGLAGLLRAEPDLDLVAEAEDGEQALALAEQWRPDVVVMDVSMPGVNGIEATRRLRRDLPAIAVVGLSMHDSKEMADAMRAAGAAVYLSKDGAASTLVDAIRTYGTAAE